MPLTPADCAAQLFSLKDQVHDAMLEAQMGAIEYEQGFLVPASAVASATMAATVAAGAIKECNPELSQLPLIQAYATGLSEASQKYQVIEHQGVAHAYLPAKAKAALIEDLLNYLANAIHEAASSLAQVTGVIKGCQVVKLPAETGGQVAAYCSGVLKTGVTPQVLESKAATKQIEGKKKDWAYPVTIEHKLGVHRARWHFTEGAPGKHKGIIHYDESGAGYAGSKPRQQGVIARLKDLGFDCLVEGYSAHCWGEVTPGTIRRLATWVSLLINADIGIKPLSLIPPIVTDWAWERAGELNAQWGDETYNSGQGQPNWSAVIHQFQAFQQKLKLQGPLEKLLKLAAYRDRHHELEAKYQVEHKHGISKKGLEEIVANGQAALALIKELGWKEQGLGKAIALLQGVMDTATQKGTLLSGSFSGPSDAVGHIMHLVLDAHVPWPLGGCGSAPGGHMDINAGTVDYCLGASPEGVAEVYEDGTQVWHPLNPNLVKLAIIDEQPDATYNLVLINPAEVQAGFRKELTKALEKKGFKCAEKSCAATGLERSQVHDLAVFLSRLSGLADSLGADCLKAALAGAEDAPPPGKGVLDWTVPPPHPTAKSWKNWCQGKGIAVPTTPEEAEVQKLTKGQKTYAGCVLQTEPSKADLVYCQGVRQNPQSIVNALVTPQGIIHFHHGTTDPIATILTGAAKAGGHSVSVALLPDGTTLSPEQVTEIEKVLEGVEKLKCGAGKCTGAVTEGGLHYIALFLSNQHHIYKLDKECLPKAVQYAAIRAAEDLKLGEKAYQKTAYPWVQPEWEKEVCAKAAPPPPALPEEIKPPVEPFPELPTKGPVKGKPPYELMGCEVHTAAPITLAKQWYCLGAKKIPDQVVPLVKIWASSPPGRHHVAGFPQPFRWDTKYMGLQLLIPELAFLPEIHKALVEIAGPSKPSKAPEGWAWGWWPHLDKNAIARVAVFLSHLQHVPDLPEACRPAAIQYARDQALKAKGLAYQETVYPYLTTQWDKEVCSKIGVAVPVVPPVAPPGALVEGQQVGRCTVGATAAGQVLPKSMAAFCEGILEGHQGTIVSPAPNALALRVPGVPAEEFSISYTCAPWLLGGKCFLCLNPPLGKAQGDYLKAVAFGVTPTPSECAWSADVEAAQAEGHYKRLAAFLTNLMEWDNITPSCYGWVLDEAWGKASAYGTVVGTVPDKATTWQDWNTLCEEAFAPEEEAPEEVPEAPAPPLAPPEPVAMSPGQSIANCQVENEVLVPPRLWDFAYGVRAPTWCRIRQEPGAPKGQAYLVVRTPEANKDLVLFGCPENKCILDLLGELAEEVLLWELPETMPDIEKGAVWEPGKQISVMAEGTAEEYTRLALYLTDLYQYGDIVSECRDFAMKQALYRAVDDAKFWGEPFKVVAELAQEWNEECLEAKKVAPPEVPPAPPPPAPPKAQFLCSGPVSEQALEKAGERGIITYARAVTKTGSGKPPCFVVPHPNQKEFPKGHLLGHHIDGQIARVDQKGAIVQVSYIEAEKKGAWKKRQAAVSRVLAEHLAPCALQDDTIFCDMLQDKEDTISLLANFLSRLHAVEELPEECIRPAVQHAFREAETLLGTPGAQQAPYPYKKEDWLKDVCVTRVAKPAALVAKEVAQKYTEAQLLDLAFQHGVDPSGTLETLAKKLVESGIEL